MEDADVFEDMEFDMGPGVQLKARKWVDRRLE